MRLNFVFDLQIPAKVNWSCTLPQQVGINQGWLRLSPHCIQLLVPADQQSSSYPQQAESCQET